MTESGAAVVGVVEQGPVQEMRPELVVALPEWELLVFVRLLVDSVEQQGHQPNDGELRDSELERVYRY